VAELAGGAAAQRGIGTRLLHHAAAVVGKPLRILNVEVAAGNFLTAAGAEPFVAPLEMLRATLDS